MAFAFGFLFELISSHEGLTLIMFLRRNKDIEALADC